MAHVGTSTVFVQGQAGPYPVYVTVIPPAVVPGQAMVSVLCDCAGVRSVLAGANVLNGSGLNAMPQGVPLALGPAGSHEFHGGAWIMTQGSWQVRVTVQGAAGEGVLAVPISAAPTKLMRMSRPFAAMLVALGVALVWGLAAIGAALVREAQSEPGTKPTKARTRLGYRAAAATVAGCAVLLAAGNRLWTQEIARYSGNIYQPLRMDPKIDKDVLHLRLGSPTVAEQVFSNRRLDDLVLDHEHLMHLYAVRWPDMDVVLHLHPEQVSAGDFGVELPAMPEGEYRLFADIVHGDGFPETAVATVRVDEHDGRELRGDDAGGAVPPFVARGPVATSFRLADGFSYRFAYDSPRGGQTSMQELPGNVPLMLRFTLLDERGKAPRDMGSYMGMGGHLAVIKQDGTVFAHIHPNGSAAMAAYQMANAGADAKSMGMDEAHGNQVAFPFGFPSPGRYRLVVQMKHGGVVETGVQDVLVR
jgi:hypothetical protein